ncbi:MAG: YfhO family protein [Anaerolineae bacterium]
MNLPCDAPDVAGTAQRRHSGNHEEGWSWRDSVSALVLAILVLLFFWRILTPNLADRASFPPGDFAKQFWAFATFEARELASGQLPLWNPYTYAGAPFWADVQSAVLYPPSLLTIVLAGMPHLPLFALELEAIAHFWLAGIFTYMLMRRATGRRDAALLSALVFTFGGYLTGYPSQQLAVLETDVWLPLILYLSDVAIVNRASSSPALRDVPRRSPLLLAGIAWGVALLAGHPQSAMLVGYTFTLYTAFIALAYPCNIGSSRTHRRGVLRVMGAWACIVITGLGLAAVAWLPAWEYMRLSVRSAGVYDKMAGGFPLYDVLQLLLPGSVSYYSPLYVGILPLLFAIWGFTNAHAHRREIIFWTGLALGALLLSFGGETFLYAPFYLFVPGFGIFRGQERLAFLFSLALAALAGYGFSQYAQHDAHGNTNRARLISMVRYLLLGSIVLVLLFFIGHNATGWQDEHPFRTLLAQSVWLIVLLGLGLGLLRAYDASQPSHTTWARIGLGALIALDLFTANWRTNLYPSLPEEQTVTPSVVETIRTDVRPGEVFRVYNEYRLYENYGVPFEMEDTWGASPLRLARYDALYHTLRMERVWQLLNVHYVITWRQELYAPSQIIYQEPAEKDTTYVHRLESPAPRAWLVYRVEEVAEEETLARLDDRAWDPMQVALLPPGDAPPLHPPARGQTGEVVIRARTSGSIALDVITPVDGLLVVSEIYYPGWRAYIDGQPVDILPVNYILRGVVVPAGQHQVEMVFRPLSFTMGAVISAITLLALVGIGLFSRLRRY